MPKHINSYSGTRWRSISFATWNITPGDYLIGVMGSIAGVAGTTGSMSIYGGSAISINPREGVTATSVGNRDMPDMVNLLLAPLPA